MGDWRLLEEEKGGSVQLVIVNICQRQFNCYNIFNAQFTLALKVIVFFHDPSQLMVEKAKHHSRHTNEDLE